MMRTTRSKADQRSLEMAQRDKAVLKERTKEQEERTNKIARLRALRLAKEAADREAAEKLAAEEALAKSKAPVKKARLIKRKLAPEESAAEPEAGPARP